MLKGLTYRKKNQLLIVVSLMMAYLIYVFAIKKTIGAYNEYTLAEKQMELLVNAPIMSAQLEKKLFNINSKIGHQNTIDQNAEQALLELITNYCQENHVVLRAFPETTVARQRDLFVETNMFIIEGGFSSLLNLVYELEQKSKLGKIVSVRYQLKKDLRTKDMSLIATIYLQNIKQHLHER